MPPLFPIPQRAGINTQPLRHAPPGQAELSAGCGEAFGKRSGWRQRIVAKKPDDCRHVASDGSGCVAFPVRNRGSVDIDLFRNLLLEAFEAQTASAGMVT